MAIRDNLVGGAVLDTLEEIAANTESGKAAGALAVKDLNENLKDLSSGTYYDEETETLYIQGGTSNYTYDSGTQILYVG